MIRFPCGLRKWCSMKIHILIALVLFWCLPLRAQTIHAASCSQANVQTAINSASDGDTVDIPSGGTCTYTSAVTISGKYITLTGLGITTINSSAQNTIHVTPTNTGTTRITGFKFNENGVVNDNQPTVIVTGISTNTAYRIDHNTLTNTDNGTLLDVKGNGPGLIDHNTFSGGGSAEMIHNLGMQGLSTSGWTDDVIPGSANMLFIEDNTFTQNGGGTVSHIVESYNGARTVIRHNTLTMTDIDQHGTCGFIYARWWEIYGNNWVINGITSFYAHLRGGSGVVWGNTLTGTNGSGAASIQMQEDCGSLQPQTVGGGYEPSGTRVQSPAYVWGNSSTIPIDSNFPVLNRDYFISTNQPSTLTRCESAADQAAGCPVSYNYTPYIYPHPLQGASSAPPPPSGLTAVVH